MKRYFLRGTLIVAALIGVLICAKALFPVEVPIYLDMRRFSMEPLSAQNTATSPRHARSGTSVAGQSSHRGAITLLDVANDSHGAMYGIRLETMHDFLVPGGIDNILGTTPLAESLNDAHLSGLLRPHLLVIHSGRGSDTSARAFFGSGGADNITTLSDAGTENDQTDDPLFPGDTQINITRADSDDPATAPVPEPGTILLFGAGLAGLGFKTRKKPSISSKA